jgi:protein NUD1
VKSQPPSPEKVYDQAATPEWKRRLLQGDRGYGDQTELFGPTGIQNLFAKPPEKVENQKPKNLSFLKHLDTIPSSPPWQPSSMASESTDDSITQKFTSLNVVDETEEIDRASSRQSSRMQTVTAFRIDEGVNPRNSDADTLQNDRSESKSPSPDGSKAPRPAVAAAVLAKSSRDPSAQSNNDSFSAVFISKHNTADGGIAYAPIDLSRSELAERLAQIGASNTSICSQSKNEKSDEVVPEEPSVAQSEDLPTDLPMGTPDLVSLGEFVTVKRGGFSDDGSFRRRPLSPSPLRRESRSHLEHSTVDVTIEESVEVSGKFLDCST